MTNGKISVSTGTQTKVFVKTSDTISHSTCSTHISVEGMFQSYRKTISAIEDNEIILGVDHCVIILEHAKDHSIRIASRHFTHQTKVGHVLLIVRVLIQIWKQEM